MDSKLWATPSGNQTYSQWEIPIENPPKFGLLMRISTINGGVSSKPSAPASGPGSGARLGGNHPMSCRGHNQNHPIFEG